MLLLVFLATLYSVAQLMALGSWTRSITWRDAVVSFSLGLSGAFAAVLAAEYAGACFTASDGPSALQSAARAASYRLDPIIEEAFKIAPLSLFLLWPSIRQRLNLTDIILLAAASGAGFGLAEATLTLSTALTVGQAAGQQVDLYYKFYTTGIGAGTIGVPTPLLILRSWLPAGAFSVAGMDDFPNTLNFHTAYSVFAGVGLAIIVRFPRLAWLGVIPLLYSVLTHAGFNAATMSAALPFGLSAIANPIRPYDGLLVLLLLIAAVTVDTLHQRRALATRQEVRVGPARFARLFASNAMRWRGLRALWTFMLERRAYLNAPVTDRADPRHAALGTQIEAAASALRGEDHIDTAGQEGRPPYGAAVRIAVLAVGILLLLPTILFAGLLGVGAFEGSPLYRPSTAPTLVGTLFTSPIVYNGLIGLTALGIIMQLGGGVFHARGFWKGSQTLRAHQRLGHGLGLFAAFGGAAFGMAAIYRSFGAAPLALMQAHALERWLGSHPLAALILAMAIGLAIDLSPLGRAKALYEALRGVDLVTAQKLTIFDRAWGLLPFGKIGKLFKGKEIIGKASRTIAGDLGNVAAQSAPRVIITTEGGAAITPELLRLQGTSKIVGDFQGISGAKVEEIISRVPGNWTLAPQQSGMGIRFLDDTGVERLRLHGPSVEAPPGSNSAVGWTARIHVPGTKNSYYDNLGNIVGRKANEGHIPIYGNPNTGY